VPLVPLVPQAVEILANRYGRYTTTSAIIHCRDRLGVPEWALGVAAGNAEMMAQSGALALVTIS
jgi:hypothetical protein